MSHLTRRIRSLRAAAYNWRETQRRYFGQRLRPALRGLSAAPVDCPWMKRKAHMLAAIIRESAAVVSPGELLVGYNFPVGDREQRLEMLSSPPDREKRDEVCEYLAAGTLSESEIEETISILDRVDRYTPGIGFTPEREPLARKAPGEGLYWCGATAYNHTVIGYEQVLRRGFRGLIDELTARLGEIDAAATDDGSPDGPTTSSPESLRRWMTLESMLVVAEAAAEIGERYANHVRALKDRDDLPERTDELAGLEARLRQVPARPARTFAEALQSLWFAHIINTWEDGINANSLGRLDQILYPFYRRDVEAGRLTREEAFELLCCLWIKLYREYDVQQVMVGGVDAEGHDATNELTYLMLDVTEALEFVRCLSVRLHSGSPRPLLRRAMELVAKGNGIPFFFNDDVLVPALTDAGIAPTDARDYAAIGCVEITIPGKANPHAVSDRVNLLKCLELSLNSGRSMTTGERLGPDTGAADGMRDIEAVMAAYERQVEHAVHSMCRETVRCCMESSLTAPMPYKSLLTDGCIGRGRDFNDRGARYDFHESMPMGIPNVADSIAAIDLLVFHEERVSLGELADVLRHDFPDERLRLLLRNRAPKYGNDIESVDRIAARVFSHYCGLMRRVSQLYGLDFFAQPFTFLWLVEAGKLTAATPDGRHAGENLAYSISPMQGRDASGLSALINSLARLPQRMAPGSTSAIVEIDPALFKTEGLEYPVAMLETAIERGVGQLQFNVVNEETLRKAQADPGRYRNLAVRVSGFSQRFCLLSRDVQDHIIARTKHARL